MIYKYLLIRLLDKGLTRVGILEAASILGFPVRVSLLGEALTSSASETLIKK
jgi:hypothetical protein